METVTILLPTDMVKRITQEAEERGVTVAEFAGLCVAAWIRSTEPTLEVVDSFRDEILP